MTIGVWWIMHIRVYYMGLCGALSCRNWEELLSRVCRPGKILSVDYVRRDYIWGVIHRAPDNIWYFELHCAWWRYELSEVYF